MTKILDCTLRDGGYYNNWDFDINLVKDYLKVMDFLKVDFIEIGFRSLRNDTLSHISFISVSLSQELKNIINNIIYRILNFIFLNLLNKFLHLKYESNKLHK